MLIKSELATQGCKPNYNGFFPQGFLKLDHKQKMQLSPSKAAIAKAPAGALANSFTQILFTCLCCQISR